MMQNTRILVQSSRRILTCLEEQGLHYGPPQNGIIRDATKKAQELADSTLDKMGDAGKAVKETVQAGYEKVRLLRALQLLNIVGRSVKVTRSFSRQWLVVIVEDPVVQR